MKKLMILTLVLVLSLLVFTGCSCDHDWEDATCDSPRICSKCDEEKGSPLDHSWLDATCDAPKTCELCGETEGEALEHAWEDATCETPKTCSLCDKTKGEAEGHEWVEATCQVPKTCDVCEATEGSVADHDWADATYSAPKTCLTCGEESGQKLVRADLGMTNDQMIATLDATLQVLGFKLQYWGVNEQGWPVYDVNELTSGAYTNTFIGLEPNPNGSGVYALYACAEDVNDQTAVAVMGVVAGATLKIVDQNFDADKLSTVLSGQPEVVDGVAYYYMADCGLIADLQVDSEVAVFWIYPEE